MDEKYIDVDRYTRMDTHPLLRNGSRSAPQHVNLPRNDTMKEAIHATVSPEKFRRKRGGWLGRRTRLWILGAVIVLIVIAMVIVGAVVGTKKREEAFEAASSASAGASPVATQAASPSAINAGLPNQDLQVDTSLAPVAFVANTSSNGQNAGQQSYGVWYQSKCANMKGVQNSASWVPYGTAFTDATNVSGLTGFSFFNNSLQSFQTYLFYVGVNGQIRDKKLNPNDNTFELGSLAAKHMVPAAAPQQALADNSSSAWDGYAMAAVYSEHFPQGPGARLFYHAANSSGAFLQELIWVQATDQWTTGTTLGLGHVLPVSHIAMAFDEANAVVRLMYAVPGSDTTDVDAAPTLQEHYMSLSGGSGSGNGYWQQGQAFAGLARHASSGFALAAAGGASYLYRVTPLNATGPELQIQELPLPAANSSVALDQAAAQTVAVPDWLSKDDGGGNSAATLYAPVAAVGSPAGIRVFFADGVVNPLAGYARLVSVDRQLGHSWAPAAYGEATGQTLLPLDDKCAKPQT